MRYPAGALSHKKQVLDLNEKALAGCYWNQSIHSVWSQFSTDSLLEVKNGQVQSLSWCSASSQSITCCWLCDLGMKRWKLQKRGSWMPHLWVHSALYPRLELKLYFGQVVNLLQGRELSGECKTKNVVRFQGLFAWVPSHALQPQVSRLLLSVWCLLHIPALPPKSINNRLCTKTFLGNFQGGTWFLWYQSSCYKTLYSCFFFEVAMRKQSSVHVVGYQSSVCGMIAGLAAPVQPSRIPKMCLCVFEGESKTAAYCGGSVELF